jgi:hypothetical protein
MIHRERCGQCRHGAHPNGPCTTKSVTGPPSDHPAREGDHGDRTVTACDCKVSTPYRNGKAVV